MSWEGVGDEPKSCGPDRVGDKKDQGAFAVISDPDVVVEFRGEGPLHGDIEGLQPLQVLKQGRQFGRGREVNSQSLGCSHRVVQATGKGT